MLQPSDSTLKIKAEDGHEIMLTVLKRPIPLDDLSRVTEADSKKRHKRQKLKAEKLKLKPKNNYASVDFLKEPISLKDWNKDSEKKEVTFKVETIQGPLLTATSKKRENSLKLHAWKENALSIFENSYVYPFIHSGNRYKCFVCSNLFVDANSLKDHTVTGHSFKDLKRQLFNRVRDTNIKVDISNLQCKLCYINLPNFDSLKTHLKDHGKKIDLNIQDNLIPFKLGNESFECQVCGEKYLKLRLLIIHMSKHFNNYSCELCGSVFISHNLLKRHLQTHETGNFPCDKCDKVFSNSAKRILHVRGVHLKQLPRRCPICPERFNSNYQRTKHLRIVHKQNTGLFKCETCGREYDLKYHLMIHIRSVHLQERNLECPICPSRFFSKYCLSRHMVIHTGEKNFKCNVCGKAYARSKNLKEHLRLHDVGRNCSICGHIFADETKLIEHVNERHGGTKL